jgi:hypothetical protein
VFPSTRPNAESYRAIRGKNYFNRILKNVRAFREIQEREGKSACFRVAHGLAEHRRTVARLRARRRRGRN